MNDLDLLIHAVRGAGDVAKQFTGQTAARWDKPDGAGPVTEADLAVNAHLLDVLRAARPHYGWLSEESEDDTGRLSSEFVFIVDPIDGTRSFIEGGKTWAHSVAVAQNGTIVAGAVYLPMRDMLFAAQTGRGATLNGQPLRASVASKMQDAQILAAKPNLAERFWHGPVPEFRKAYRPSLAYRMALVGQGRFHGMITFRPTWDWDIAAGTLIAEEAGAKVTDRSGTRLHFNTEDPRSNGVIAACPSLHDELARAHISDSDFA